MLLLGQAPGPLGAERAYGVVDVPDRAANPRGDHGRALCVGVGQEYLGTPQRERLAATKSGLEYPTLRAGQRPNE